MAKGVNRVILVGNCGQDPDIKVLDNGNQITNISVATSESWKDKKTGNKETDTTWHKVVFFNQLAKIAGDYLRKGSMVYIEGSIRTRKWQADDGTDRYATEIVAKEMQMLGGRGEATNAAQGGSSPRAVGGQPSSHAAPNNDGFDDNFPF